jgi:hypothetical protein
MTRTVIEDVGNVYGTLGDSSTLGRNRYSLGGGAPPFTMTQHSYLTPEEHLKLLSIKKAKQLADQSSQAIVNRINLLEK